MSAPRPGDLVGARYVLADALGEGASATVYRARDQWRETDVAVKVFRCADDAERTASARLEHALARDLGHPALTSAIDAGRFGAHPFVVLELAPGDPLDLALRGADPRQIAQVIDTIASALAALHARGLVHGDLKPANVRVARRDQQLKTRLLDLGCARASGTVGGGTAAYAAPEAIGGTVTSSSDLFSLGVVAWEALTGQLPFGSPADPTYLTRLARAELSRDAHLIPPELAPVLRRLLAHTPAARYGSAGELRAALHDVVELQALEEAPPSPALVERDALLAALRAHTAEIASGVAGVSRLAGAPRSGRSRLLALAAAEARIDGFATIETSARSSLVEWLRALVEQAERIGGRGAAAARSAIDAAGAGPDGRHARLFTVLTALQAAAAEAPLVVFVDDADDATPPVRDALRFLAAAHGEARIGWVIVDRADEGPSLRVGSVDEESVTAVISSLLPGIDGAPELARLAYARTGGTVGRVVEGTLALVHAGAVRFVGGQWRCAAEGVPDWAYEAVDDASIDRGLERLGRDAHHTLAAIALDGGSVELAIARLGLPPDRVARISTSALRAGILRQTGAGLEFTSRDVRARLIAWLDDDSREALRRRAIDALAAARDPASRAARARHLAALGRHEEAAEEALDAASMAASAGDLYGAAEVLDEARSWGLDGPAGRVALALGSLRASLGETEGALTALDEAHAAGVPVEVVARVRGRVLARGARYEEAIDALRLLETEGALDTEDRFWLGWSLMMRGRYDDAEPLAAACGDHSVADRARLGRLAGTIAWHRGDFDRAREILVRAKEDAHASNDRLLLAEVEQSLGTAERLRGNLDAAAVHYGDAIDVARRGGYAAVLAKALNNLAVVEYQSGRWERARHAWESMQELAVRLDAHEEILLAHNNLGLLFQDRGELERAERSLDQAIEIARRCHLARYEAMALGNRAEVHARAGRLDAAEADLDIADSIAQRIGAHDERRECRRRRAAVRLGRGDGDGALIEALAAAEEAAACGASAEVGHAYFVAAAAARSLGRIEDAERHVASAAAAWAGGATRLDLARLDLERARVRLAAGDRREAVRIARHAGRAFAELGAEPELAEVRSIEDADLAVDRGEALLQILQVAGEEADATALLDRVLDRIVTLTGAERGVVITFAGDEQPRIAARRGFGSADPVISRGIADRAIESRRALVLADVDDEIDLAGRESVLRLGVRAALCAPLMQGESCLGLLYVDSTRGPELVRFGLWVVDAAAAILAPALARIAEREREQEREALLRTVALDAIDTVGAIDSALDLVADALASSEDAERLRIVRDRCHALIARSQRLLDFVRLDGLHPHAEPEAFSVRTLVASALEALEGSMMPHVELGAEGVHVFGDLERLASAVTRMVESAVKSAGEATTLRVFEAAEGGEARPRERAWRPGASAGRRFVRIEVEGAPHEALGTGAATLPLRAARRVAARNGGRLFIEPTPAGERIVMEIEAMEARS